MVVVGLLRVERARILGLRAQRAWLRRRRRMEVLQLLLEGRARRTVLVDVDLKVARVVHSAMAVANARR